MNRGKKTQEACVIKRIEVYYFFRRMSQREVRSYIGDAFFACVKRLKFVTLNGGMSRGGENFIIQLEGWSRLQIHT